MRFYKFFCDFRPFLGWCEDSDWCLIKKSILDVILFGHEFLEARLEEEEANMAYNCSKGIVEYLQNFNILKLLIFENEIP